MRIRQFLDHHGITENPFADEDAQTDLIFKGHCITSTYHPTWEKIYGNPAEPATAIVFGEKGSGKTAMALQIVRHLADYNADHPDHRAFVVRYDDFNPYLDRFRERFTGRRRRPERMLQQWKLWDHMDAILSRAVTQLVDRVLGCKQANHPAALDTQPPAVESLDRSEARDLLLLASCYDQSTTDLPEDRWHRLRRKLRFPVWQAKWDMAVGIVVTVAVLVLIACLQTWNWLGTVWPYLVIAAGWLPRLWRTATWFRRAWSILRSTRALNHQVNPLRRVLMNFPSNQVVGQPLPILRRTDDRYELLAKLQNVLRSMGFDGIIVLVDRVDEPYLINGSADLMRALVWPLLDNKCLKTSGVGFKLLLPAELGHFIDREERDFHQRARLDKQNLVPSLDWTGQSLYDLAESRMKAVAADGRSPSLAELFDQSISQKRLVEAMRTLRVPRHLFKFLYRLIVTHINAHMDDEPVWRISSESFETVLALYQRERETYERSVGAA